LILTNKEVIAIDQDPLGQQGHRVAKDGDTEVWVKRLADGGRALLLFNRGDQPARIRATAEQVGLAPRQRAKVRDLWAHKDLPRWSGSIEATIEPHGVAMFRIG